MANTRLSAREDPEKNGKIPSSRNSVERVGAVDLRRPGMTGGGFVALSIIEQAAALRAH
jgi:hypothetical protein